MFFFVFSFHFSERAMRIYEPIARISIFYGNNNKFYKIVNIIFTKESCFCESFAKCVQVFKFLCVFMLKMEFGISYAKNIEENMLVSHLCYNVFRSILVFSFNQLIHLFLLCLFVFHFRYCNRYILFLISIILTR